jgi:hypothetical protein
LNTYSLERQCCIIQTPNTALPIGTTTLQATVSIFKSCCPYRSRSWLTHFNHGLKVTRREENTNPEPTRGSRGFKKTKLTHINTNDGYMAYMHHGTHITARGNNLAAVGSIRVENRPHTLSCPAYALAHLGVPHGGQQDASLRPSTQQIVNSALRARQLQSATAVVADLSPFQHSFCLAAISGLIKTTCLHRPHGAIDILPAITCLNLRS